MRIPPVVIVLMSSLAALPLEGQSRVFSFDPPAPDSQNSVAITVRDSGWTAGCVPRNPRVTVTGSVIVIRLSARPGDGGICTGGGIGAGSFSYTVYPGVLAAGTYDVVAEVELASGVQRIDQTKLFVRGADPFRISAAGAPVEGGIEVFLTSPDPWGAWTTPVAVSFGGVSATTIIPVRSGILRVTVPPHPPGIVDVVTTLPDGATRTAPHAFTYYGPSEPADPFVFEPILFPISLSAPGAYGSIWRTENAMQQEGGLDTIFRELLPCDGCGTTSRAGVVATLDATNNPAGLLLHAVRGTADSLLLASRIHDQSRGAETAGTEVPVVREKNWRHGGFTLLNVPADSRSRTMLRIWLLGDGGKTRCILQSMASQTICLLISRGQSLVLSAAVPLAQTEDPSLFFATFDMTPRLGQLSPEDRLIVRVTAEGSAAALFWGMVSITNNVTQQVTLVTPN